MINENDQALYEALKAVVTERGFDYVYPDEWKDEADDSCFYLVPGTNQPACIFGAALLRMGVEPEVLAAKEGITAWSIMGELGGYSLAVRYASANTQSVQDEGGTWGDALSRFEEDLGLDSSVVSD